MADLLADFYILTSLGNMSHSWLPMRTGEVPFFCLHSPKDEIFWCGWGWKDVCGTVKKLSGPRRGAKEEMATN